MDVTKDQAVSKCKNAGLNVKLEDGVVKLITDPMQRDEQVAKFKEILDNIGYKCSWGYRCRNNSDSTSFVENNS